MLSRDEKARAMLAEVSRGGAVRLPGFHPAGFNLSILHTLAAIGIPNAILHGGALRDAFMKAACGYKVEPDDYDVRARLQDIAAYHDYGPQGVFDLLLGSGFILNPYVPKEKNNPEVLYANDASGKRQTLATCRMIYEGKKIDFIASTTFNFSAQELASVGGDSFSALAMGEDGIVYADRNFLHDAAEQATTIYTIAPEKLRYILNEHIPKLSKRYGYIIQRLFEDGTIAPSP